MDRSTKHLLMSEWHSAHNYLARLFHALLHQPIGPIDPETQEKLSRFHQEIEAYFAEGLFQRQWTRPERQVDANIVELLESIECIHGTMVALLRWRPLNEELTEFCVGGINLLYDLAYELHWMVEDYTDLEIQYPRLGLLKMNPMGKEAKVLSLEGRHAQALVHSQTRPTPVTSEPKRWGAQGLYAIDGELSTQQEQSLSLDSELIDGEGAGLTEPLCVAHFSLPLDDVHQAIEQGLTPLLVVDQQREKRYEAMIQEGHEAIFHKDYAKALEAFLKAQNYIEKAEVLTLIGWAHSLVGQMEKAKSYCLKAIQKDPDYGPPYNDLGSYLLAEGQVEESLKWFDLAKRAINYQNREYPYINSGRAFMTKKDLNRALEEFSKALTLAPYHEDLHKTVEKLKRSLVKGTSFKEGLPPAPPTH